MSRQEKLLAFIKEHDNKNFNSSNIPKILENLKKADEDGKLRDFLLNKKPCTSAFTFFVFNDNAQAARGKDQVSIVFALNLYGANKPGFAAKLNGIMKELATGSSKAVQSVVVLMRAQAELQILDISLINFVDKPLLETLNKWIKRKRVSMIILMAALIVGGAIGMPGFTMAGLIPLTFVAVGGFVYGFIKIFYWIGMKPFPAEMIDSCVQPIGECFETETEA